MAEMSNKKIQQEFYQGERPLFGERDLQIEDTVFGVGESPLKESSDISLQGSMFQWKYPLWYSKHVEAKDCAWQEMARAGVWYAQKVKITDTLIEAPKNFRRCKELVLEQVDLPNAQETLWHCSEVSLKNVSARGDYFAMNCENMVIDGLRLSGNYSFDGVKNVEIRNSKLLSKDAFWNSENVTVYDSYISGEYLGWNSKDLTLVNCTIESLQGLCYIDNLVMRNCKLLNTTLAFEYSTIDAQIVGKIESVLNPRGGVLVADEIQSLILEPDRVDVAKTKIDCPNIGETLDKFVP